MGGMEKSYGTGKNGQQKDPVFPKKTKSNSIKQEQNPALLYLDMFPTKPLILDIAFANI